MNSEKLSENDRNKYRVLIQMFEGQYSIPDGSLTSSLQTLSQLLEKYYGQKVIILIDEYDVPLDKAFQHGYYKEKENSYHTLLVGLLAGNADWLVKSNVEAGEGVADIVVETEDPDAGIVMELKYVKEASGLEKACEKALIQIKDRRYEEYLKNDGRKNILLYGLAFCKKRCKVVVEERIKNA